MHWRWPARSTPVTSSPNPSFPSRPYPSRLANERRDQSRENWNMLRTRRRRMSGVRRRARRERRSRVQATPTASKELTAREAHVNRRLKHPSMGTASLRRPKSAGCLRTIAAVTMHLSTLTTPLNIDPNRRIIITFITIPRFTPPAFIIIMSPLLRSRRIPGLRLPMAMVIRILLNSARITPWGHPRTSMHTTIILVLRSTSIIPHLQTCP